jgi:hypothetical protein
MNGIKTEVLIVAGLGLAAVAVLYYIGKNKGTAENIGFYAGEAAADVATGAVAGAAIGIGTAIGIPQTNVDACAAAKASGSAWDVSFACPAGDFLGYINPF